MVRAIKPTGTLEQTTEELRGVAALMHARLSKLLITLGKA